MKSFLNMESKSDKYLIHYFGLGAGLLIGVSAGLLIARHFDISLSIVIFIGVVGGLVNSYAYRKFHRFN